MVDSRAPNVAGAALRTVSPGVSGNQIKIDISDETSSSWCEIFSYITKLGKLSGYQNKKPITAEAFLDFHGRKR